MKRSMLVLAIAACAAIATPSKTEARLSDLIETTQAQPNYAQYYYGPYRRHVRRVYRRAYRRAYYGYGGYSPYTYGGYSPYTYGGYSPYSYGGYNTPMEDIIRTPMEDIIVRPISGDGVFRRRLEPVGTLSDVEVGEVV